MGGQNKELVRKLIDEVWNRGNLEAADLLIAADYLGHSSAQNDETRGREAYKAFYVALRAVFPEFYCRVEEQIAEGDRVVTRWSAHGTDAGGFRGISPAGRQGTISGITISRIAGGKVIEGWTNADDQGLMRLLDAVPEPTSTPEGFEPPRQENAQPDW